MNLVCKMQGGSTSPREVLQMRVNEARAAQKALGSSRIRAESFRERRVSRMGGGNMEGWAS